MHHFSLWLAGLALVVDANPTPGHGPPGHSPPWHGPPGHDGDKPISSLVDLGYSRYQGVKLDNGINEYLGMRFAAPPLGDLRWRAPQDPATTAAVQPANAFGPLCLGVGGSYPALSEDCLFVNVFAPSNATTKSKLPVWFFISGGGYAGLSNANYNGSDVIQASNQGLVFVNMNYRVGAFGFLASDKIRKDGNLNAGLLDQRKAMQWVQKYIHLFGGDPDHVIIHGVSAGAGSVAHHLTWDGGRDDKLFAGAIAESPFFPAERTVSELEFQFDRFADGAGCSSNASDVLGCLRSKDTASLQTADVNSAYPEGKNAPDFYFLPVIDGDINKEEMYVDFQSGRVVKVPLLVGNDNDEGGNFAPNAASNSDFLQFIKDNYPDLSTSDLARINASYPLTPTRPTRTPWFGPSADAYGDSTFICPGNLMAASMAWYVSPAKSWNYHYDVPDPGYAAVGVPVPHTIEMPAVLGPSAVYCSSPGCSYAQGQVNHPMVAIVMPYFISFVQTLDPNPHRNPATPEWKPWGQLGGHSWGRPSQMDENRLHFLLEGTSMETVPHLQNERCQLWRSLAADSEQ